MNGSTCASSNVAYALGPEEEVGIVRQIYTLYVDQDMTASEIQRYLNNNGLLRPDGVRWKLNSVARILRDPKYAGCSFFGRNSQHLRSKPKRKPQQDWIVQPNSFEAIVPMETFELPLPRIQLHSVHPGVPRA